MDKTVTPSPLCDKYIHALQASQQEGRDLLSDIHCHAAPRLVVRKIADYVDHLLAGNRSPQDLREYALQLGALFGCMIEKEYGWQWQRLHFNDSEGIFLVSPSGCYRCSPLYFLNRILTSGNGDMNEENNNAIVRLFNRINGIENHAAPRVYRALN